MRNLSFGELKVSYKIKSPLKDRPTIKDSREALEIFLGLYNNEESIALQEQFIILYLNNANKLIGSYNGFRGSCNSTLVDFKIIIGSAINLMATAVIVCHNHPSGQLKPSEADLRLTKRLNEALDLMDIKLLDHLIIAPDESYLSFADAGLMIN